MPKRMADENRKTEKERQILPVYGGFQTDEPLSVE